MARRFLDTQHLYFAVAGILVLAAIASQFELHVPSRRVRPIEALQELRGHGDLNVVFVLIDTLRAHRLGVYGYARPTSPVIDAAAASGILFEDVVSQSSWTKTSMASLWTATWPSRNGILRYDHVIPDAAVMPAERLQDAGFRTVGLWRNGWVEANFGFAQGFDVYVRPTVGAERVRLHREARTVGPVAGTDEDLTISALAFLDQFGDERFFLYLHYMDVHQYVYDEAAAIFGNGYSDIYDQSIRWVDRLIGVLLEALEEKGLLTRTLVVIAADHGEAFLEHGFEGHARDLHEEVTHVPLILLPPFLLEPGVRVRTTVANVDVWPTLLDLLGLPPLPDADGRSLVSLVFEAGGAPSAGASAQPARPAFAQLLRGWGRTRQKASPSIVAVTHAGKRLFASSSSGELQLFDRAADPGEQKNLAEADPQAAAQLKGLIDGYAASAPAWGGEPERVELDELRLNHLRALGYLARP